jgi:hypothetical protein
VGLLVVLLLGAVGKRDLLGLMEVYLGECRRDLPKGVDRMLIIVIVVVHALPRRRSLESR